MKIIFDAGFHVHTFSCEDEMQATRWMVAGRWDMCAAWHVFFDDSEPDARARAQDMFERQGYMEVYAGPMDVSQDHGPGWRQPEPGPWERKREIAPEVGCDGLF